MLTKRNLKYFFIISLVILSFVSGACSDKSEINTGKESQEITVFAAASLTESLKEIVEEFKRINPDSNIQLNLSSSSRLRVQIEQGVQADIYLSANKRHYEILREKGFVAEGKNFLSNTMVVVVPRDNPANINNLIDLTKQCKLVVAQKEVPAGSYALQVLNNLEEKFGTDYKEKVLENVVSRENNVKQVLAKVIIGEADAAFVYSSDITPGVKGKVKLLQIPDEYNVKASYWAAILKGSQNKDNVKAFYEFLTGEKGQEIFKKYGFTNA